MVSLRPCVGRLDLCNPATYRITVQGCLDAGRAEWFDAFEMVRVGDTTMLIGVVADQAALHGLLNRVRDLGLPLIEVSWLAAATGAYEEHRAARSISSASQ